jgi:hypothetical protein
MKSNNCYGLKQSDETKMMHVGDKVVNDMMGKFKDSRLSSLGRVQQEHHEGIKGAQSKSEPLVREL